jgi:hypothetical protein
MCGDTFSANRYWLGPALRERNAVAFVPLAVASVRTLTIARFAVVTALYHRAAIRLTGRLLHRAVAARQMQAPGRGAVANKREEDGCGDFSRIRNWRSEELRSQLEGLRLQDGARRE